MTARIPSPIDVETHVAQGLVTANEWGQGSDRETEIAGNRLQGEMEELFAAFELKCIGASASSGAAAGDRAA